MLLTLSGTGRSVCAVFIAVFTAALSCGCATHALRRARADFYGGRFDQAVEVLNEVKVPESDEVLFLMERGMALHNLGRYAESSHDFIKAADRLELLRTYSISKGASSMLVNDMVQDFTGFPFEQSLLHVFTAKNHFAEGHWDNAAVESRRLIKLLKPDRLGSYPDDAYVRYIAGLGLEMIDDWSNASLQYKKAGEVCRLAKIADNGLLAMPDAQPEPLKGEGRDLICLVSAGKVPRRGNGGNGYLYHGQPVYAEIYAGGKKLGRSYTLTDTAQLAFTSEQIDAAREAVKTVARVVLKDAVADSIQERDAFLGSLAHIILIQLLEQPDRRRWETLPRWLGVARLRWTGSTDGLEAVFRTDGYVVKRVPVTAPVMTRRNMSVTFVRDIVPVSTNVVTGQADGFLNQNQTK